MSIPIAKGAPWNDAVLGKKLVPELWAIIKPTWPAERPMRPGYDHPIKADMIDEILKQTGLTQPINSSVPAAIPANKRNSGDKLKSIRADEEAGTIKPDATFRALEIAQVVRPKGQPIVQGDTAGAGAALSVTALQDAQTANEVEIHPATAESSVTELPVSLGSCVAKDSVLGPSEVDATAITAPAQAVQPLALGDLTTTFDGTTRTAAIDKELDGLRSFPDGYDDEPDHMSFDPKLTSPPLGGLLRRALMVRLTDVRAGTEPANVVKRAFDLLVLDASADDYMVIDGSWSADTADLLGLIQSGPFALLGPACIAIRDEEDFSMPVALLSVSGALEIVLRSVTIDAKDVRLTVESHPQHPTQTAKHALVHETSADDFGNEEVPNADRHRRKVRKNGWSKRSASGQDKVMEDELASAAAMAHDRPLIIEWLTRAFERVTVPEDFEFFEEARSHPLSNKDRVRFDSIGARFILHCDNKRTSSIDDLPFRSQLEAHHQLNKEMLYKAIDFSPSAGKTMVKLYILAHYLGKGGLYASAEAIVHLENDAANGNTTKMLQALDAIVKDRKLRLSEKRINPSYDVKLWL